MGAAPPVVTLNAHAIGFRDALVIGLDARSPRGRRPGVATTGSTTYRLLHAAGRPVLVVPIDLTVS